MRALGGKDTGASAGVLNLLRSTARPNTPVERTAARVRSLAAADWQRYA